MTSSPPVVSSVQAGVLGEIGGKFQQYGKVGPGPFGDGALRPGKWNLKMFTAEVAAAKYDRTWEILPDHRRLAVTQLLLIIGQSTKNRDKVAAVRALAALDTLNAHRERTAAEAIPRTDTLHHTLGMVEQVAQVRPQLLADPAYAKYLRAQSLAKEADRLKRITLETGTEEPAEQFPPEVELDGQDDQETEEPQ